jgi:hypothetical protein
MKKVNPIAQVIFSPLTAYLFIGTSLLFLSYKFELGIKHIGNRTKSNFFKNEFVPTEYHKKGIWFTLSSPIIFWFILIYDIALIFAVTCVYLYEYIIECVELLFNEIIRQVQLIWDNVFSKFK